MANASRVVLYQFHNGGVFLNKNPQWYLAVADEALAPNIGPAILGDVSTLASRCFGLIDQFWDAEGAPRVSPYSPSPSSQPRRGVKPPIVDVEWMEPGFARACLIKSGVKKLVQAPIRDDGGICGYLSVEFCGEVANLENACKIACACAERIGSEIAVRQCSHGVWDSQQRRQSRVCGSPRGKTPRRVVRKQCGSA